jgi:hypothetical protein
MEQGKWELPTPFDCGGDFLADPASSRSEADAIADRFPL